MFTKIEKEILDDLLGTLRRYIESGRDYEVPNTPEGQEFMRSVINHVFKGHKKLLKNELADLEHQIGSKESEITTDDATVFAYLSDRLDEELGVAE